MRRLKKLNMPLTHAFRGSLPLLALFAIGYCSEDNLTVPILPPTTRGFLVYRDFKREMDWVKDKLTSSRGCPQMQICFPLDCVTKFGLADMANRPLT